MRVCATITYVFTSVVFWINLHPERCKLYAIGYRYGYEMGLLLLVVISPGRTVEQVTIHIYLYI